MKKIAIVSTDKEFTNNFKNIISQQNFFVLILSLEQLSEHSIDLAVIDFSSQKEFNNINIRKEYHLKNLPILGVYDINTIDFINLNGNIDDFCFLNITDSEIILRIKHLLYRIYGISLDDVIQIKGLMIDLAQHKILIDFETIDLTYMEFKLLHFLVMNKNRVFSREFILERVWGYDYYGGARTVDVHIRRLRSKLGSKYGQFISTVRNVGYKFSC